jgi:glycosyltransferase involved in cell wall biosynthesis
MVCLVIPALNEAETIGEVVRSIPRQAVDSVIVVDNGSTDATAQEAAAAGAVVTPESKRGYGRACRAGCEAALRRGATVLAFIDGDGSDCAEFLPAIIGPVARNECDFVIGSRLRGQREPGSMTMQQLVAGRLAGLLVRWRYGVAYTDMSPLRAIRADRFQELDLREETYGWNLEMQMRAAQHKLRILEIPVNHRNRRGGQSKVSGNFGAALLAAYRIALAFCRIAAEKDR